MLPLDMSTEIIEIREYERHLRSHAGLEGAAELYFASERLLKRPLYIDKGRELS